MKAGTRIVLPGTPPHPGSSKKVLFAVCGGCASCTVSIINPPSIDSKQYERVILLFTSPSNEIPEEYFRLGPNVKVIADPTGTALTTAGLSFDSRFYLLSPELKIVDAQESIDKVPIFVKRIVR